MEAQVAELAKLHAPSSTVSISTLRQLAALVLTQESRPPYSLHAENSFAHLQIRFGQHAGIQEQRLFKLSPLLAPAPVEVESARIAAEEVALQREQLARDLERRAEEVAAELIREECASKEMSARKTRPDRANTQQHSKSRPLPAHTESARAERLDVTVEELSAARGVPIDEASFNACEWTEVRARRGAAGSARRKSGATNTTIAAAPSSGGDAASHPTTPMVEERSKPSRHTEHAPEAARALVGEATAVAPADQGDDGEHTRAVGSSGDEAPVAAPFDAEVLHAQAVSVVPNHPKDAESEVSQLRSQVRALQSAIEAKDAAHAKELAEARDREAMRLQALQLRLYIKDSRIAALEGALRDHIAAVGVGGDDALPPAANSPVSQTIGPAVSERAMELNMIQS